MIKRSTLVLLAIFAVFGTGAAWIIFSGKTAPKNTSYAMTEDMEFSVPQEEVHKVFIADRKGTTTTLEREGDHWIYNGKYIARPNAITNLLHTVSRIKVKYRPPHAAVKSIVEEIAAEGIKVEIYGKDKEMLKSYYIGMGDDDGTGTFMVMEGYEQIFAMYLPTLGGGLRPRYYLPGKYAWRDRHVFQEKLEDIQSVSVEYPKQRNKSFRVEKKEGSYEVSPFYSATPGSMKPYKKGTAEQYLNGFKSLQAEAFQNGYLLRDTISTLLPFCNVKITKIDGTEKEVRFVPFLKVGKDGQVQAQAPDSPVFRFHALTSWGDMMLVQNPVFQPIFQSYDFFFEE